MAIRGGGTIGALILTGAVGPALERPGATNAMRQTSRPTAGSGPTPAELNLLHSYAGPELSDPSLLHRLRSVAVPALGVWGNHDAVSPPAYGRKYVEAVPNSRFVEVDGGHLPFIDDPTNAIGAMTGFLDEVDRDAGTHHTRAAMQLPVQPHELPTDRRSS